MRAIIVPPITLVRTCGDCNGSGADYVGDVQVVACSTCGGSGQVEYATTQIEDSPSQTKQD